MLCKRDSPVTQLLCTSSLWPLKNYPKITKLVCVECLLNVTQSQTDLPVRETFVVLA